MQHRGTLRTWHDDRGFGFIAPADGGAEVFVHVSAFAADGSRPVAGERLLYETGPGRDGKPQALRVVRVAVGAGPRPARVGAAPVAREGRSVVDRLGSLLVLVLVIAAGAYAVKRFAGSERRATLAAQPAAVVASPTPGPYRCDGRTTCSQMTSCAEATWFINNCPGTTMDGNCDGVPCEQQWCGR